MKLFTIGFTKKSAEDFFSRLKRSGAKKLVDVQLDNVSQLAGFANKDDLRYFTKNLCGMEYEHIPALAPTQDILDQYRKNGGAWDVYEDKFLKLMAQRHIEEGLPVERLAAQAGMSKRTLARHFTEATGTSPADWIISLRVSRAKELLETTSRTIEEIATHCGFGSAPTLRHHFRERVRISPVAYRAHFRPRA